MPGPSSDLARLHTRWALIAEQPASTLTADQRRSVEYFLADTGQEPHPSREIAKWAAVVHELDAFVAAAGRMPAADHRRPRPRTPEQRLVDQVAYLRLSSPVPTGPPAAPASELVDLSVSVVGTRTPLRGLRPVAGDPSSQADGWPRAAQRP